jgi:hypothetical protein
MCQLGRGVPVEVATAAMRSRGGGSAISCFNPEPGADVPANTGVYVREI